MEDSWIVVVVCKCRASLIKNDLLLKRKTELFSIKSERFCCPILKTGFHPSELIAVMTEAALHLQCDMTAQTFGNSTCFVISSRVLGWKHPEGAADNTSTGPLCSDTNYFCRLVVRVPLHWTMLRDSLVNSQGGRFHPVALWPVDVCKNPP